MLSMDDMLHRLDRYGPHPVRNWPHAIDHYPAPEAMDPTSPNACFNGCERKNCHQWICISRVLRACHYPRSRMIMIPTANRDLHSPSVLRSVS